MPEQLPLDKWVRSAILAREVAEELVSKLSPNFDRARREQKIAKVVEILIEDGGPRETPDVKEVVPLSESRKALLRQIRENRRLNKPMPPPRSQPRRG